MSHKEQMAKPGYKPLSFNRLAIFIHVIIYNLSYIVFGLLSGFLGLCPIFPITLQTKWNSIHV